MFMTQVYIFGYSTRVKIGCYYRPIGDEHGIIIKFWNFEEILGGRLCL